MNYIDSIKNKKKIAIIMGTYNGARYISEQIDSIMNNSCQEFILHVCDDGSTDDTLKIVDDYMHMYPNKIIIHKNQKNLNTINNMILWTQIIDSEYYMFCDQDDVWDKKKIEKSYSFIRKIEKENMGKPVVIFTDAEVVDGKLEIIHKSFQKYESLSPYKLGLEDLLMENKLLGCSVMFNKKTQIMLQVMKEIPHEIRMHDWWVGLIGAAFGKVAYLEDSLLKYRQHGGNVVGSMSVLKYLFVNITKINEQKKILYSIFRQGGKFLEIYREYLTCEEIQYLTTFSTIEKQPFFKRKYMFIKNRYRKTGFIKNVGMFILV